MSALWTLPILALIAYDDLRHRSVRLYYFLLFFAVTIILYWSDLGNLAYLLGFAVNLIYVCILLLVCLAYVKLIHEGKSLFDFLGAGDILFLMGTAAWFSPEKFVLFNTASFIAALLIHLLRQKFSTPYASIPLAGYQAICLGMVIISLTVGRS
jgi:hypothetical protein